MRFGEFSTQTKKNLIQLLPKDPGMVKNQLTLMSL
jgi:hypothetical protein